MADDGATREPPGAPIGRVRIADPGASPTPEAAPVDPADTGWSATGVGIAILMVLIMIGALVIILWAAFQTRA